jgi:16S rRNA G1207 methylase RsmC
VWALDVNERALSLTAENAERSGVAARVRPVTTADLPDDISFRAIYSNPPIRIGKAALHELLGTWLSRLSPDGTAWLVVHKHLGSDSLAKWLEGEGFDVRRLVSRMGYRLLEVRPR